MTEGYTGRFAPSPTGPLHFGSLIAAVGSYLQARSSNGRWLLRMDDIDPPREEAGAKDLILRQLEAYGFEWDRDVVYQGQRSAAYDQALAQLSDAGHLYPCSCSRKLIASNAVAGLAGPVYPGTCRDGVSDPNLAQSLRVRTDSTKVAFDDLNVGPYSQQLERDFGDFIVRRTDGLYAYHLAVVVDDAWQGVTEVVRGSDLLDSTPRQIWLQQLLGLPTPAYRHLPTAVDSNGDKLSKQTFAHPLPGDPIPALHNALNFLGQTLPDTGSGKSIDDFWAQAIEIWDPATISSQGPISIADYE